MARSRCACVDAFKKVNDVRRRHHQRKEEGITVTPPRRKMTLMRHHRQSSTRQAGFSPVFQDPHIHAEPANDEITGMNGRVFTRCSEAVEKQGATMSFDVDVRADLRAAWERRGLKPSAWCS
jgi:hypothetical protein